MDLLQTVRKEGSRGGRANFKWEDVKNDQHRENYLGHSLMAPVGRWQTGKDLSWYAKSGNEDGAPSAEDIRKEELRRIKEAEEDALNLALGLPVASRNPNLTPMGAKASESDVKRALAESTGQEEFEDQKGIGFGSYNGRVAGTDSAGDILEGEEDGRPPIKEVATRKKNRDRKRSRSREHHRRSTHREDDKHRRRRSRSGDRERHLRAHSSSREERRHRRFRSRSRERRRHRSRSQSEPRDSDRRERRDYPDYRRRDRYRSRSPRRDRRDYRNERG